jgi:hypothetical protein
LRSDLVKQSPTIVANDIDIEVRSIRKKCEMRIAAQPVERRFQAVRTLFSAFRWIVPSTFESVGCGRKLGASSYRAGIESFAGQPAHRLTGSESIGGSATKNWRSLKCSGYRARRFFKCI